MNTTTETPSTCLRTIPVEIASSSPPNTLDFIASDATLDRCDEVIDPAGWQLDNYRRNPVFQNSHQYGDILFTLGKALITEVRSIGGSPALFQRVEFACDINPMARIAYGLYQGKFLNAVSVGFIPLKWLDPEVGRAYPRAADPVPEQVGRAYPRAAEASKAGAPAPRLIRRKYLQQELLEVSAVGIPANPNALQLGVKSGAVAREDLRELAELVRFAAAHARPGSTVASLNATQLLDFAKTIRAALRA
ncbi:MAG TPA: hypothetical protein VHH88_10875 [Verrucomicrobiae bacterium]|nr:hypothetical protein [Verrucomicrobiae bacterium]